MANEQSGSPITAEQADQYLQKYKNVKSDLRKETPVPLTQPKVIGLKEAAEVNAFYNSDVNAFIFSKELILRFFTDPDRKGKVADFLMVILGAKYDEQKNETIGKPTVVVAGVIKDPNDTQKYLSMDTAYAADEQPPTGSLGTFPGHGLNLMSHKIDVIL